MRGTASAHLAPGGVLACRESGEPPLARCVELVLHKSPAGVLTLREPLHCPATQRTCCVFFTQDNGEEMSWGRGASDPGLTANLGTQASRSK